VLLGAETFVRDSLEELDLNKTLPLAATGDQALDLIRGKRP
jgi:hypothetical protein